MLEVGLESGSIRKDYEADPLTVILRLLIFIFIFWHNGFYDPVLQIRSYDQVWLLACLLTLRCYPVFVHLISI